MDRLQKPHLNLASWSALILLLIPLGSRADELIVNYGGGSQESSRQENRTTGVDYAFYRREKSQRQHLLIGVSYSYLSTDANEHKKIHAFSIYPQLSLFPSADGKFAGIFPGWAQPYFFVRALGPSYISGNQLGDREQSNHFAFQAQVGFGLQLDFGDDGKGIVSLSFKHFSNANFFEDNDGLDFPVVLSLGVEY
jgi:hypothetical protein